MLLETDEESNKRLNKEMMKHLSSLFFIAFYLFISKHLYDLSVETSADFEIFTISYMAVNAIVCIGFFIYKRLFNPFIFVLPFLLSFFYYQFFLSYDQSQLNSYTIFAIFVFFLFYYFGCVIFVKCRFTLDDSDISAAVIHFVFLLGMFVYLIEAYLNGGIAVLKTIQGYNAYVENNTIPILHYAYMMLALMPSCYYFLYKKNRISRVAFLMYSLLCFLMIFDSLSRQLILLMVFSFFFSYVRVNELSLDSLFIRLMLFCGVFFILVGSLRYIGGGTEVDELEFMKLYANIKPQYHLSIFDITFNLYTSKNFSTLNDIVLVNEGELHLGKYFFQAYIKVFGFNYAFDFGYDPTLDSYSRLGTIISDPYLDFGLPGVAFFAFVYGVVAFFSYSAYVNSNSLSSSLLIAVVFYSLFMSPFTNYFNQLFVFLCIFFAVFFKYKLSYK